MGKVFNKWRIESSGRKLLEMKRIEPLELFEHFELEVFMVEMKTVIPKIDEESGVAWLTLNRPEKKNAMSRGLMAEMIALLKELRDNDKIRCIVTTGAGNSYSSGLDLYDLRESWKRKRRWDEGGSTYEIVKLLRNAPQVTVAAINGWC